MYNFSAMNWKLNFLSFSKENLQKRGDEKEKHERIKRCRKESYLLILQGFSTAQSKWKKPFLGLQRTTEFMELREQEDEEDDVVSITNYSGLT